MKTKLFVLCYVLLLACSSDEEVPKNMLSEEKMIAVLLDIYMAEGKVNNLKISRDSAMAIFKVYENRIFEKNKITDSVYRESINYYYNHPDRLEAIYETVLDSLNLREQRLKEKSEGDKKEEAGNKEKETKDKKVEEKAKRRR